jgi:hypothetical protein
MTISSVYRYLLLIPLLTGTLLGFGAAQSAVSKSKTHFVLSSPDTQLAISLPQVYTANAFGCAGGNTSPAVGDTAEK